ncbi:MAG: hypothetical protein HY319_29650 [Armatimonadetes bacterium]|nr:hypothetical protein [Armatimonadota bacterium]
MTIPKQYQPTIDKFKADPTPPPGVGTKSVSHSDASTIRELHEGAMDYFARADQGSDDLDRAPDHVRRNLMGPSWFDEAHIEGTSKSGILTMTTSIDPKEDGNVTIRSVTVSRFRPDAIDVLLINIADSTAQQLHVDKGLFFDSGTETPEWHIG